MRNDKGQALIELIIFLPLMLTLYSVISGFASAINGSINQQKVTRSYFYYRAQNNSNIPGPRSTQTSWKQFGMFYIGWKDYFKGGAEEEGDPIMPCYEISIPFRTNPTDNCEDTYSRDQTLWVRVGTVYGVCGVTLTSQNNRTNYLPNEGGSYRQLIDRSSCIIQ